MSVNVLLYRMLLMNKKHPKSILTLVPFLSLKRSLVSPPLHHEQDVPDVRMAVLSVAPSSSNWKLSMFEMLCNGWLAKQSVKQKQRRMCPSLAWLRVHFCNLWQQRHFQVSYMHFGCSSPVKSMNPPYKGVDVNLTLPLCLVCWKPDGD